MGQLAPEVQQFPEAAKLVARMQVMIITATSSSGMDAKFQAVCGSTEDANTLSQLMAAGLLYKKYQTAKDNPELGALLDQTNVVPSGDHVVIRMTVSDDQLTTLIKKNNFGFKIKGFLKEEPRFHLSHLRPSPCHSHVNHSQA